MPQINEECFCLEPKTRKRLRARVTEFDSSKMLAQVRFMDTGHLSTNHTLNTLIEWKNFDLYKMPAKSLRCVFYKENSDAKYEKGIFLISLLQVMQKIIMHRNNFIFIFECT